MSFSDHLSDRELYTELWQRVLREKNPALLDDPVGARHADLLGGCREDDIFVHMKYYADERYRQQWLADFPDYVMPAHEDPPFHRDCRLPQAYDEVPSEDGDDRTI